ncbi:MAG: LysR family transcriptional regulator [Lachnospiraceae bacterium]|jgi:LysR family transcriptional activator of glutamate synthase operon|nr:LysR family transcriptional regulator [Lachnospiraceae bacterium]
MNLKYLHEFVVLSQLLQFQEAADVLYISQPTLSKHIQSMEAELGNELFIRTNRSVQLSEFGQRFLPYAVRLTDIEQEYTADLLNKLPLIKKIVIGYVPVVTLYTFLKFFSGFAKLHPEYQYTFLQGNCQQLFSWLQQKKVDFILTSDWDSTELSFEKRLYAEDQLVAVIPERHVLAAAKNITLPQLHKEPLILFSEDNSLLQPLIERSSLDFHISFRVDKADVLNELLSKDLGIAVLTRRAAEHFRLEHCMIKPFEPDINLAIYMVYLKDHKISSATKAFSDYLIKLHP